MVVVECVREERCRWSEGKEWLKAARGKGSQIGMTPRMDHTLGPSRAISICKIMETWENQLRSMEVEGNNDKHIGRLSVLDSAKTSLEHA